MSKRKNSSGFYMWINDFYNDYPIVRGYFEGADGNNAAINKEKKRIIEAYYGNQRQAGLKQTLIDARTQLVNPMLFNNEIDKFFLGPAKDGAEGYIAELQKQYDQFYTSLVADAKEIFSDRHLNLAIASARRKNQTISHFLKDLKKRDVDLFKKFKDWEKKQNTILENLQVLASFNKSILKDIGIDGEIKFIQGEKGKSGQILSDGKVYDISGLAADQKTAAKFLAKSLTAIQNIQDVALCRGGRKGHSPDKYFEGKTFVEFRNALDAFHADYGENVAAMCAYAVQAGDDEVFTQLGSALPMGTSQISAPIKSNSGAVAVNVFGDTKITSKDQWRLQEKMKNNKMVGSITSKADVFTHHFSMEFESMNFGENIKNYSSNTWRETGNNLHMVVNVDSYNNIVRAATQAVSYGAPQIFADKTFIANMAGGLYGRDFEGSSLPGEIWGNYKKFIAQLLLVDAIMGRMYEMTVDLKKSNNLVFVMRGKVYYLPALLQQINFDDVFALGYRQGPFLTKEQATGYGEYTAIEKLHWDNRNQSSQDIQTIIEGSVSGKKYSDGKKIRQFSNLKVAIDLQNLLHKQMS